MCDVVQIANESGRDIAPCRVGASLDRSCIFHDRKLEHRSSRLRIFHHRQCGGVVVRTAGTIPIDDHAGDATADHVINLRVHLRGIGGVIAHIHVVTHAKPGHEMCVYGGCGTAVQQRADWNFAYAAGSDIPIALSLKTRSGTGIVGSLGRECSCRCNAGTAKSLNSREDDPEQPNAHTHKCLHGLAEDEVRLLSGCM